MELDMTKGSPSKLITKFIIPIIIGNIFQQLYSMVDTTVIQHGGYHYRGSVRRCRCIGGSRSHRVGKLPDPGIYPGTDHRIYCADGTTLRSRGPGGYAQKYRKRSHPVGDRDDRDDGSQYGQHGQSASGDEYSGRYFRYDEGIHYDHLCGIICAGIACNVLYNLLSSILRAIGNSVVPLVLLVIASVTNIVLDYVLIVYGHMGVGGAAYATIISQGLSGVLCLIYIIKSVPTLHIRPEHCRLESQCVKNQLTVGIPMALQFSITAIGTILVQAALNLLGSTVVASYSVSCKVEQLVTQPFAAMGVTMPQWV